MKCREIIFSKIKQHGDDERVKHYLWMESEVKGLSRIGTKHARVDRKTVLSNTREVMKSFCSDVQRRNRRWKGEEPTSQDVQVCINPAGKSERIQRNLRMKELPGTGDRNLKKSCARMN